MLVSETLREAIEQYDGTYYRLAKDSGVDWAALQRFMDGTRPNLRLETVDKLCQALGLELRPVKTSKGKPTKEK
jgi:DNA-binding Xre family transcriptional regulator